MKRLNLRVAITVVALMTVFIIAGSAGKVQADPSPQENVNRFCTDNGDFAMSHGECVSIGETNINALADRGVTDAVTICKILEEVFGPFPLGRCISRFASN